MNKDIKTCVICSKAFDEQIRLIQHIADKHHDRMWCPICEKVKNAKGKKFNETTDLVQHVRTHFSEQGMDMFFYYYGNNKVSLLDSIAGDESDGVYFAMAWEMGIDPSDLEE